MTDLDTKTPPAQPATGGDNVDIIDMSKMSAEKRAALEVIPTGAISLDIALGIGGLPRGRVVEIYGQVHRDGWFFGRVTDPVDALVSWQHGRDPIFPAPLELPELVQAGMIG